MRQVYCDHYTSSHARGMRVLDESVAAEARRNGYQEREEGLHRDHEKHNGRAQQDVLRILPTSASVTRTKGTRLSATWTRSIQRFEK